MKKIFLQMIAILLLMGMCLCMFACDGDSETPVDDNDVTVDDTNEAGLKLPFDKADYNKEVTILYTTGTMQSNFFFDDVTEAGDIIKAALMDRRMLVEDYLGVQVVGKAESTDYEGIVNAIRRDAMAGVDQYQIALTHNYIGVGTLVSSGYIKDLYEMEDYLSFDEEYWHLSAMEELEVGGKAYYGNSDFMISDVCAILYNKDMYEQYQIKDNPYELVKSGKWTLEKFMELCSNVAVNDGDPAWTKEDTYGLGVRADWEFLPLVDSCDVKWLVGNTNKTLNMGPTNERYQKVYEACEKLIDAEWSYLYNYGDSENKVTIADGRFLFTMEPIKYANTHLASGVKFGVLPYPKFDEEQADYKTGDYGGLLCVPNQIRDTEMVAKTLECLSFYSAETINLAYYERLLGTRVAEAPDDAEMLKEYIFGKITLNPAMNYSGKANQPLGILVYTIPKMLRAKLNGTTVETIATTWAANKQAAQKVIDETLNR